MSMTFYQQIPAFQNITDITDLSHYHDVPTDWYIALTDVQGSTVAIQQGKYKEVNAIAAASITAIINLNREIDLPFVFGGDGATILIPPALVSAAREALAATRELATRQFGLNLRVGIVPVMDVLLAGYAIQVAKLAMSPNFQQAIFIGGGMPYAEKLLKNPPEGKNYGIEVLDNPQGNFAGFECRWNAIPSPYEETISLMVMTTVETNAESSPIYQDVLQTIETIYGNSLTRHPIRVENLHLAFNPVKLSVEARVRHGERSFRRLFKMWRGSFKAWIAMRFNIGQWGSYRGLLAEATDNEKFDDTLRMIIAGTRQQREQLRHYLEEKRQAGSLVYGTHASRNALVTCVIFDYFGKQVHFVDAADGGYALAAQEMKAQLKARTP